MTQQYLRKASLLVGDSNSAIDLSDLRFTFDIQRGDIQTPNSARIRIFNLSDDTAQRIQKEFTRIVLQAGYENGPYGLIFDGVLKQIRRGRASQTDTVCDITAASGDEWYNWATVGASTDTAGISLAAGSNAADHVAACTQDLGRYGLSYGFMADLNSNPLPRGKVLVGMVRDHLRNTAENLSLDWSVQDKKLQMVRQDSYIPTDVLVITSQTGMIGLPEQTQNGIKIKLLLNPNAIISGLVQIDNKSIQQHEFGLTISDSTTKSNAFAKQYGRLNNDGVYKILIAEHNGDNRGEPWFTELVCLDVDLSSSPPGLLGKTSVAGPGAVKPWG